MDLISGYLDADFRFEIINLDEYFLLFLVFAPFAMAPFLDLGWPPEARPSPPPIG